MLGEGGNDILVRRIKVVSLVIFLYTTRSSAKSLHGLSMTDLRLLMNNKKSMGPNTIP